jgi:hypothetical protein
VVEDFFLFTLKHLEVEITTSFCKVNMVSQSHIATDSQPVCLSWCQALSGAHDQILVTILTVPVLSFGGHPL